MLRNFVRLAFNLCLCVFSLRSLISGRRASNGFVKLFLDPFMVVSKVEEYTLRFYLLKRLLLVVAFWLVLT